jgi:hypothetical protein
MVPSITTILHRFTGEWATLLQPDAILALCREIGYTAWRERVLTPVTTMQVFLLQRRATIPLAKTLGIHDQLVVWLKPKTCPSWLTRKALATLPDSLVLREVRYHIGTLGFRTRQITLVTTLLDTEIYRVADLVELYRQRWQVETSLAHLKTTMQMDVLHCKTVSGVLKELTVFAIVYNLVRMLMWHSAILQHMSVERISFLDALRCLSAPSPGIPLGALIVTPIRPHRVEPRVKKRRPKSFPFRLKPRQELRQQLVPQELTG